LSASTHRRSNSVASIVCDVGMDALLRKGARIRAERARESDATGDALTSQGLNRSWWLARPALRGGAGRRPQSGTRAARQRPRSRMGRKKY
jgi:hypothetical protein